MDCQARRKERTAAPDCALRLERVASAAAERGVFGSPTFFVAAQISFGNDLDFVAEALHAGGQPGATRTILV
jgi:2-hydroxychromene-2-carboxylate isomerase